MADSVPALQLLLLPCLVPSGLKHHDGQLCLPCSLSSLSCICHNVDWHLWVVLWGSKEHLYHCCVALPNSIVQDTPVYCSLGIQQKLHHCSVVTNGCHMQA